MGHLEGTQIGTFKDRYYLYYCAYAGAAHEGSQTLASECMLERNSAVNPKTSRGRVRDPTSYYGLSCTDDNSSVAPTSTSPPTNSAGKTWEEVFAFCHQTRSRGKCNGAAMRKECWWHNQERVCEPRLNV